MPRPYANRKKPRWVRLEIIRLKALMPHAGCRRLANTFNRIHIDKEITVGKTYVAKMVSAHRHAIAIERRYSRQHMPYPLPCNRTWGLDLTGKRDITGDDHLILGIIDHGSRLVTKISRVANKNTYTLLGHLFLAIGQHGKPRALRTDNDGMFRSRLFRMALKCIGIHHQLTTPGCPWQNGRIERLFGTLKTSLDQLEISAGTVLDQLLMEFRFFYNYVRPHQHLNGATPAEAWCGLDPFKTAPKQITLVRLWNGMLTGYYLRR